MSSVLKKVHDLAKQGFGTGTNELYDRARPSYQSEALAYIRQEVQASSVNIVEIGAGTGISTRALLAHPDWSQSVARLRALEPSEGMRDVFSKTVKDDRVSIADGTFDTTGVEDGWADLVLVAQAFHWCPDYNAAAAEFARILKPTGIVALIWNLEDRDAAGWVAQLRDRVESHESGTPQFRLMLWRQTFDTPNYQSLFQPHIEKTWERSLPGTLDIVVDRACSKSYIAVLPENEKKKVVEDVTQIVKTGDRMTWQDKEKGIFNYPYKTYVVIWKKK
ncbi:S-adenosyl-L-methionine-dependent methyltransferase [Heliocybe sulcata]|uniref:S-adenosyl-L-methionine-dependent methyltransferase n=1 Tax=Heliocybe sulcata TaxID=5364 RepID=A0A5C3NN34_9AGAM|nr:S-adenosyl-L-methionine-dependent methyltransferase [Heliocybe sulcata]